VFDIGLGEVAVLIVAALFVFGPDRLPQVVAQAARTLRQLRTLAAGARADLNEAIGPELRELNVLSDLGEIRDLSPKVMLNKAMFGADDKLSEPVAEATDGALAPAADGAATEGAAPSLTKPVVAPAPPPTAFDADAT
jgi:sec-independent protein translocase protein TatB